MLLLRQDTRTGAALRQFFEAQGFVPNVVLDTGSFEVIKRYIAEGAGVSFLPEIVAAAGDSLVTSRVRGAPQMQVGAVWRRDAYRTQAARAFLDLVRRNPTRRAPA